MADTKITKREVFGTLIDYLQGEAVEFDTDVFCGVLAKEIENLDKKATKARERAAEKRAEGDELQAAVLAALTEDYASIEDITANVDFEDVTVAKVRYRLGQLVNAGKAEKEDATAEVDGKTKKIKVYKLVTAE